VQAMKAYGDCGDNTKTIDGRTCSASRPSRLFPGEASPVLLILLLTTVDLDWLSLVFRNQKILSSDFSPETS